MDDLITSKLISVIIPVFNSEKYLEACVDSVLKQTYQKYEVILVDDGSTDSSWQICKQFEEKYSNVHIVHQENMGVSCARNKGMRCAKGEYLTFVDSDDELTENALRFLMEDALKYNADIVSAVKCHVLPDGMVHNPYENDELHVYGGIQSIQLSLEGDRQTNSACAKLFKKTFVGDTIFTPGRKVNEDGFFMFECYVKQPVLVQHNICIYKYFTRSQSATRGGFSEKYFDMLFFCEEKKKIIAELYPELFAQMLDQEITTHIFFLEALCRTNDSKYMKYQKDSINLIKRSYNQYACKNAHERKMAKIIKFGLFPLYKLLINRKYYR